MYDSRTCADDDGEDDKHKNGIDVANSVDPVIARAFPELGNGRHKPQNPVHPANNKKLIKPVRYIHSSLFIRHIK